MKTIAATSGYERRADEIFLAQEILYGNHVVILGKDVIDALFTRKDDPIDKVVTIGSGRAVSDRNFKIQRKQLRIWRR